MAQKEGSEGTPTIPGHLKFDGKEKFETFRNKFRNFVDFNLFDDKTAMFCLGMALRGSASRFYEHSRQHGRINTLTEALNLLNSRFGNNRGVYANMIAFQNARQKPNESEEDFADRLSELVHDAYPEKEWEQMEREVAMRFMTGLSDPKARVFLSNHCNQATMEEMRDILQRHHISQQIARPDRGFDKDDLEVRNIGTDESSEEEVEGAAYENTRAGKIKRDDRKTNVDEWSNRVEILEQRMKKMEEKVDKNTEGLSEMMKQIQGQLDRMEKNFSKDGGEGSQVKSKIDGLHLNGKESN